MTVVLDPVMRHAGVCVAALSRVTIVPLRLGAGFTIWAEKTPLAILVQDEAGTRGYALSGERLPPDAIEALMPGVLDQFAAATRQANP